MLALVHLDLHTDTRHGEVAGALLELDVGTAIRLRRNRRRDLGHHLVRAELRRVCINDELAERRHPNAVRAGDRDGRVERQKRSWPVARRVGMCQAAGDGAAVANLHVSGQVRGIPHDRQLLADERRRRDVRMPAERAHHQTFAHALEASQRLDAVHVHQVSGAGEAQLHHRQQALPSRQDLRVVAVLSQQLQRLVHGLG